MNPNRTTGPGRNGPSWPDTAFTVVGVAVLLAFLVGMAHAFNVFTLP